MSQPLVSIVTPSLNQANFIEDTILSVKEQDYPNLEHVIIDGGSTDGTLDILHHYDTAYNLRWVSERDQGQSHAINKGIEMAHGQIIGWINSDDTYLENAVSTAANYLISNPKTLWVYGDAYWIDEDNSFIRKWPSQIFNLETLVINRQFIIQPTVFYKKTILDEVGYLDINLHLTMDFDLFIRLGCEYQPGYISRALATRRIHSLAKTNDRTSYFGKEGIQTINKILQMNILPEEISAKKNRVLSSHQARWGKACLINKEYIEAYGHFLKAFYLSPCSLTRKVLRILIELFRKFILRLLADPENQVRITNPRVIGFDKITWFRK